MLTYLTKRLLAVIPIILLAIFLMFSLIRLSPVDPAEAYLAAANIHPTDEILAEKRQEFGLNQPLIVQYLLTVKQIIQLDFGNSYVTSTPVWEEIAARMPATIQLAVSSILLAVVVSIPLGFFSAIYKNSLIDHFSRVLSFLGASLPQFWLGYILIFFFSVKLDLFPVEGRGSWQHFVLPSVTLSLALIAVYTRLLRTSVLEEMEEAYVIYGRTRGLKERIIMGKHVLRIAISPMLTGLGMNFGKLLTGTNIVEQVFSWPGFGRFFIEAIFNRDIPVIQSYVVLAACLFIVCNLIVDLVQLYMDPRISRKGRAEF